MDNKVPRIRPLATSDMKIALFVIGRANLECLAVANRQAYGHPFILGVWVVLSLVFTHIMNWWPASHRGLGLLGFLKPLPAFASTAVPLMFLIDWKNRPYFEQRTQAAIKEKDLQDPVVYYSLSPASGFWVLEYGDKFIGLIALDANDVTKTRRGIVRHFYVEETYRRTGVQDDLLNHALRNAFDKSCTMDSVKAIDAPGLAPYIHDCYQRFGFRLGTTYQTVGILGRWRYSTTVLRREDWGKSSG